jgi:dTDP-glucose pyrophosphorylase
MAGEGSRFSAAGYKLPKPLVDVCGEPMIQRVIATLPSPETNQYIFIVQLRHYWEHNIATRLRELCPGALVVTIDGPTAGAAVTAMQARRHFDNGEPLLIANSDQLVEGMAVPMGEDGLIYTFPSRDTKWSYAAVDERDRVWGVAEKQVISRHATCGIYYWKRGGDFAKYASQMIANGRRSNNEFYIAPVFNEAIADDQRVFASDVQEMWGLGTPEDVHAYEKAHNPR